MEDINVNLSQMTDLENRAQKAEIFRAKEEIIGNQVESERDSSIKRKCKSYVI